MPDIQITGYHTCKTDGGWSYVRSQAPFLSGSGTNQWLTQGYYFWTDSDYFAHQWGKNSYNSKYAILKCDIKIDSTLLLDLVGSTENQIYFEKLLNKFRLKLQSIEPKREPTVHAIISYWREQAKNNNAIFPFVAIKAQDNRRNSTISFTGRNECMYVEPQRQQLCLFESGLHFLTSKKLVYPEKFKIRAESCPIYTMNR